ncbi:NADH dehydrogenase [ubiquinone] iron-sulfur protein 6, mitochondrial [Prorops nasuta]|uniref:NADH dehydrogenase [ubiquinone] iron-sulfur protein 6, mitochondrial n=1 Tax=Prorops nasuta TaxID=863751 RepID=UPI0034CE5190
MNTTMKMASTKAFAVLSVCNKAIERNIPLSNILTRAYSKSTDLTPIDFETHTGQKYNENDKRVLRFDFFKKEVNVNFAIKLIDEIPPSPSKDRVVSCDGGGGPLGHPKVYINLDKPGNHICGYCGLRFYKEEHH